MLCGVQVPQDANVIIGIDGFEDAGVYKISDEIALVQTIDFFTPVVDDPYWFGQIAAANAFSDIYAMGAVPKTAMNMVCFSPKRYGVDTLKEIIRGGIDKIREAGASLMGGHSVEDEEIKYGLSVTGLVHPEKILRNEGAVPGDLLIITKPLGTGILNTAMKADLVAEDTMKRLIAVMAQLNDKAAEIMRSVRTHAATDVTGFGLVGHLSEMIKDNVGVELYPTRLPYFEQVAVLSRSGFVPGGLYRNRDYYRQCVIGEAKDFRYDLLFDPQTSGGLLMAVHPDDLDVFSRLAAQRGVQYWTIGQFKEQPKGKIILSM